MNSINIGIKLLTSSFLDVFGSYLNFQGGQMPTASPPAVDHGSPTMKKVPPPLLVS